MFYRGQNTQKGDLEESVIVFAITGINKGVVASSIIDKSDNKNLGNPSFINMHEKKEGSHSYNLNDKVESVLINLTASVDQNADKDLDINIKVIKDGKEIFNQDESLVIGKSLVSKSYTVE